MTPTLGQLVGLILIAAMVAALMYSHWMRHAMWVDDDEQPIEAP